MISGFVIEGLDEARRKLEELTPKQMREAERTGMKAAGTVVAKKARQRAPRLTGRLAKKGIRVYASVRGEGDFLGSKHYSSEARIWGSRMARLHEMGTQNMPSRPFMRPALDSSGPEIIEAYAAAFKARIAKLTAAP